MKRVGFVINSRFPEAASFGRGMRPHHLLIGWDDSGSPMSFMRFRWIAQEVNKSGAMRYELFKPWRRYDAVVFLKSMGEQCLRAARRLREAGTKIIFEANVDYYTQASQKNLPDELIPTDSQRKDAVAMTSFADGVITSSSRLAEIAREFASSVYWVPDNIKWDLIPAGEPGPCVRDKKLQLWWSGMASKLYDFLLIEKALRRAPVHLNLVTSGVATAIQGWSATRRRDFEHLLSDVSHTFHDYSGIPSLLKTYHSHGGIIVSPRYLDSPYNQSHTEWKLTLGLACGLPGMGSPLQSYLDAASIGSTDLRICHDIEGWTEAFDAALLDPEGSRRKGVEGSAAIKKRYGSPFIAKEHGQVLEIVLCS